MEQLRFELDGGRLTVLQGEAPLFSAWAEVQLADGKLLTSLQPESGLELRVEEPLVTATFTNRGRQPVRIERLAPAVTDGVFGRRPADLRVGEMGWQSWSRARTLGPYRPDELPIDVVRDPITTGRLPDSEVSPWMALLADGVGMPLLLGFTRAIDWTGVVEVSREQVRAWCDLEGWTVRPGDTVTSEPLMTVRAGEAEALNGYGDAAAAAMQARRWPSVPTGWCSWYHFYTWVTEQDLRRNLDVLKPLRDRLPIEVFQLDDGYQRAVGDWLTPNEKFPSGMPALVAAIREAGFTPGIWLAPFLLSARSETFAQHPDWVVRDDGGAPIVACTNWDADNYALDTTNPAALDWVGEVVRAMCQDWGYDYLKIDFIYAAALRGQRHEPEVSAVQAYRRGVERIREVAGERFILGCGAPFLPSVGLVDGMRIGEDVAPFWRREANALGPAMNNAVHSTLLHNWMHGRWWINDPDCLMVRAHDSQLTLAEVRAWAGLVALSGGMALVSDDLAGLEPDRMHLLGRLFPPLGASSDALPPHTDDMPERLRLHLIRPWGEWWVLGLANWSDEPRSAALEPGDWGLPAGAYHVVDLWTGEYRALNAGSLELPTLEPHAMHLLAIRSDNGHPQVVGTTGHVLGDAMDVVEETWDGQHLTVKLAGGRAQRGDLLVSVPREFHADPLVKHGLLRLSFDLAEPTEFRLGFPVRVATSGRNA